MKNKRVLIIDDDPELCEEIVEIFNDEGYEACCVSDPHEGIAALAKGMYDILLLDYKMPGLTGVDILKCIKEKCLCLHIFVISGRPFIEKLIKEEGLSDMVSAVMSKPINFEKLFSKIKALRKD